MDPITEDLKAWTPLLIRLWRRHRHARPGPPDRLTAAEASEVTAGIHHLSEGLTRNRQLVGERYLSDPVLLGAYLMYFWPVSYAQARYVLKDIPSLPRTVLDLGSGPGPVGAACFDLGAKSITFADRSRAATALAGELMNSAGRPVPLHLNLHFWDPMNGSVLLPRMKYDLITMGHVLNELWPDHSDRLRRRADLVASLFERVKPDGHILLMEPALTPTSRDLLGVRDLLLEKGFTLMAPCLWQRACPALTKAEDSCHAEYAWSPPPWILDLIRSVKFQKKTLKMTSFLFAQPEAAQPKTDDPQMFRIVSDPLVSKNERVRLLGCGQAGRLSLALKPAEATDANRVFLTLKRGDLIRVQNSRPREGGGLDLTPETLVEVLHRARD